MKGFSTHLLDRALAKERERRERRRKEVLELAFRALEELSQKVPFEEAYIGGFTLNLITPLPAGTSKL